MSNDTIVKTIILDAPRLTVWAYLTEKDKLATWFNPAENDLQPGKDYVLLAHDDSGHAKKLCWGTVELMQKPSKLVYSFTIAPWMGTLTKVTWLLEDCAGGTKLTLRHEGIAAASGEKALDMLGALDVGWDEHFKDLRGEISQ